MSYVKKGTEVTFPNVAFSIFLFGSFYF
uniref:Uncharacterized protein n=1 Tax=Rhizophora mucronata TaxID=61149 RepID=A0A2P2PF98_RHIMU